jgi:hypothetical protein
MLWTRYLFETAGRRKQPKSKKKAEKEIHERPQVRLHGLKVVRVPKVVLGVVRHLDKKLVQPSFYRLLTGRCDA